MIDTADPYFDAAADRIAPRRQRIADPVSFFRSAGFEPDPWQAKVLASEARRVILLCCRQSGKSLVAAAMAMHQAQVRPRQLVLVGSPSERQAKELLRKAKQLYKFGRSPERADSESLLGVELRNGSRVVVVPGTSGTVRGYSAVSLLIVDEAAWVGDEFYESVFPMLAVSGGRMVMLSTPHADEGAFYRIWRDAPEWEDRLPASRQPDAWLRVKVGWRDCPRISPVVVSEHKLTHGELSYRREFEVEFARSSEAVFTAAEIAGMSIGPPTEQWNVF